MKISILGLALIVLLAPVGEATAEQKGAEGNTVTRRFLRPCTFGVLLEGRTFVLTPTRQEIDGSPSWSPGEGGEPPVSVGQASRVATAEFVRHFKSAEDWILASIMLAPSCEGRWVWAVNWQPKDRGLLANVTVPVLMSGAVVPLDRMTPTQ